MHWITESVFFSSYPSGVGLESCHRRCAAPRILVTSLAESWLRPFLNEDPCGLFAAASLLLVGSCLQLAVLLSHPLWVRSSHPLWVRSSHPLWVRSCLTRCGSALLSVAAIIHHVVLDLRLLCLLDHPSRSCSLGSAGFARVLVGAAAFASSCSSRPACRSHGTP